MILGALGSLCGAGSGVRKLVFGMFLAFLVLDPVRGLDLEEFLAFPQLAYQEGTAIREAALQDAQAEKCSVIKEQVESYILVEADSLGAVVQIDAIELDPGSMVPVAVALSGNVSAYDKQMLSGYIEDCLGIGREKQRWNGEH